ncbi:hypothetical protein NADFUDRAFT_82884 [Nadsonia fulvescens var. elongata DSM 6958]|uniref:Coatomer subunit delta n=1 Tax=Nadsonia fulvescens var. elongata DSM 6958 TaxID=857566 RepID=A0A1E3PKZ4_9ASCO|nr:hypothetical protein NADFUDRAFT_82884 [Nadsonia fulvescens var. elongata DSM 6958]
MVVLAASICTRGGRAIISRQFRDLHKDRVAQLLASFPKLTSSGTQHTTVEDEHVRYVYQPLEELYIVLITSRQSNILQTIDTLRLLVQIVTSIVRVVDEKEVLNQAFELLSAFDEVITLGYRENLSLSQISTFLEMESHEEKIQEIIERNKELEATEERKRRAKQLELQRKELSKRGGANGSIGSHSGGFGSNSGGFGNNSGAPSYQPPMASPENTRGPAYNELSVSKPKAPLSGKGLKLGKSKTSSAFDNIRSEIGISDESPLMSQSAQSSSQISQQQNTYNSAPTTSYNAPRSQATSQSQSSFENDGIHIAINETVSGELGREGGVLSAELKGDLQLRIADPELTKVQILVDTADNALAVQYKTHPNVDKNLFTKSKSIGLKDPSRGFPSNNQQIGVLRWKGVAKDDDMANQYIPVSFSCWFSASDSGFFDVTIEYELNETFQGKLTDVTILIPLMSSNVHVNSDNADQAWNQYDDSIEWVISEISPDNNSGSFEFAAEAEAEEEFYPMSVKFGVVSETTLCGVNILDIVSAVDNHESIPFTKEVSINGENITLE